MRRANDKLMPQSRGSVSAHPGLPSLLLGVLCLLGAYAQGLSAVAFPGRSQAQQHAHKGFELARQGKLKEAEVELRRAVELAPDSPDYLFGLGSVLGTQQRLQEAEGYFLEAVTLAPSNLTLRRNLAANQWQLGKLEQAKANLELILKSVPGDVPTLFVLGMVMEGLKDYARAAELLGSVTAMVRQHPESLGALVRAYYRTGQNEKARRTLEILQEHPAGLTAALLGAQTAAEAEDYQIAERLFRSIQSVYPHKAEVGYDLALVEYRMGRFSESQQTLLDLIQRGNPESRAYHLLGWCYLKQGQAKEALHALEKAVELDPSRESNYLDLALILAGHKRLPDALATVKECARTHPASYRAHLMKGLIEFHMDHYTDAVASFEKAIELQPSNPDPYRGLAVAQFGSGMTREALATFERVITQFPQSALLHQDYGKVLLKLAETGDAGAEPRAADLFQKALALDPSLSESHCLLGNLALKQGRITDAVQHLESAAQRDQKSSRVHYALSRAYRRLGRIEAAAKELEIHRQLKSVEENTVLGFSALLTAN